MKRKIAIIITIAMLLSRVAYAIEYSRVQDLGLIGQGESRWDSNITREELATIAIRLSNNTNEVKFYKNKSFYKDINGWSTGYINLSKEIGLMSGTSKTTFSPKLNVTYIELLTVIMRVLEYEDNIDFMVFPQDYYEKSLELGLANMYIDKDKIVTREIVAQTLEKSLDMELKNKNTTLLNKLSKGHTGEERNPVEIEEESFGNVEIENLTFNTSIASYFGGKVIGRTNFKGYLISLSSKNGSFKKEQTLDRDGKFSISNFDIDILTKLSGYEVRIIDSTGKTIYETDLK